MKKLKTVIFFLTNENQEHQKEVITQEGNGNGKTRDLRQKKKIVRINMISKMPPSYLEIS